jgi:hypothetical protein
MIKRKRTKGQTTIQKEMIEQLQDHERQIIAKGQIKLQSMQPKRRSSSGSGNRTVLWQHLPKVYLRTTMEGFNGCQPARMRPTAFFWDEILGHIHESSTYSTKSDADLDISSYCFLLQHIFLQMISKMGMLLTRISSYNHICIGYRRTADTRIHTPLVCRRRKKKYSSIYTLTCVHL